jgi:hypothetical protein
MILIWIKKVICIQIMKVIVSFILQILGYNIGITLKCDNCLIF